MADIHLLGLFNNVEPTADAIDRLHKLGVTDEQITVMSGAPYRPDCWAAAYAKPGGLRRVDGGASPASWRRLS